MFAVILQSKVQGYNRQVAVVPHNDAVLMYSRLLADGKTKQRGNAGSWVRIEPSNDVMDALAPEALVGQPIAIEVTPSDVRDLDLTVADLSNKTKPTTLLQKLARAVDTAPSVVQATSVKSALETVYHMAFSTPANLSQYSKRNSAFINIQRGDEALVAPVAPVVQQAPAIQPAPVATTNEVVDFASVGTEVSVAGVPKHWAQLTVPSTTEPYFEREFDGLPESTIQDTAIANGENILMTGDAVTGKTQSAINLARRLGVPFVQLVLHQTLDNSIVEGRLLPDENGGWSWHYSKFATAFGQPSVILLNELSRSSLRNTTLFLPILEEGLLHIETLNEVIKRHPQCIIIADQNIGTAYTGAQAQDSALLDRFDVKLEFGDDPAIERQIIPSPALLELAEALRFLQQSEPAKHKTRVGTRMLKRFVSHSRNYNFAFAVRNFLNNFPAKEREAVAYQVEARYINIAQELGVPVGSYNPMN